MEEVYYLNISINDVMASEADDIIDAIVKVRGTRQGMSVGYMEPIADEED